MAETNNKDVTEELEKDKVVEETVDTEENKAAEESAEETKTEDSAETENAQDTEAASEETDTKEKKDGIFGKKKKKDKKDAQIEDLNDRLRRQMAEFDNFRKRSEKEKSQMFKFSSILFLCTDRLRIHRNFMICPYSAGVLKLIMFC